MAHEDVKARNASAQKGQPSLSIVGSETAMPEPLFFVDLPADGKVEFAWYPYQPIGEITLSSGLAGLGKTTFWLTNIARASRGLPAIDGTPFIDGDKPSGSLIFSAEDNYETVLRPQLASMGADLSLVAFIPRRPLPNITTKDGKVAFRKRVQEVSDALKRRGVPLRQILLDPIKKAQFGINTDVESQVAPSLVWLLEVAQDFQCSIIAIIHPNKSDPTSDSGSAAYRNTCRSRILFLKAPLPDHPKRFVFEQERASRTVEADPIVAELVSGEGSFAKVMLLGKLSKEEAAKLEPDKNDDRSLKERAATILKELTMTGPVIVTKLRQVARTEGIDFKVFYKVNAGYENKSWGLRRKDKNHVCLWYLPQQRTIALKLGPKLLKRLNEGDDLADIPADAADIPADIPQNRDVE